MGGGSWKVAYADFVTAMMAFFLLMWILNMAPKETLRALAGYFAEGGRYSTDTGIDSVVDSILVQYAPDTKIPENRMTELEKSHFAITQALKTFLLQDPVRSNSSGLTSDSVGVMLNLGSNLMFKPGTVEFTAEGMQVLDEVVLIMRKYKVYIVVRGHADSSESGAPYSSRWELSAARCNAAVRYFITHGIDPNMVRSVAYADTRPNTTVGAPQGGVQNSRVEFNFHRPEIMSNFVGY